MSDTHHFRKSMKGFHREDVVHYIEFLNSKHASEISKMNSEIQALKDELEALHTKELTADNSALEAVTAQRDEALAQVEQLRSQLAQLQVQMESAGQPISPAPVVTLAEAELEAYRRAERMERNAKARADEIYQKATATLADATAQLEGALSSIDQVVDVVTAQISELHTAAENSKTVLQDAVATMYAIRPENAEE